MFKKVPGSIYPQPYLPLVTLTNSFVRVKGSSAMVETPQVLFNCSGFTSRRGLGLLDLEANVSIFLVSHSVIEAL
jgi:hypothetical protein